MASAADADGAAVVNGKRNGIDSLPKLRCGRRSVGPSRTEFAVSFLPALSPTVTPMPPLPAPHYGYPHLLLPTAAKESSVHRNPHEGHDAYDAIRTQDADLAVSGET